MSTKVKELILFLIPPEKLVNGGVMSIFSLAKETREIKASSSTCIELCVYIGHSSYHKNDLFENDEKIYDFETLIEEYPNLEKLTIHIPELAIGKTEAGLHRYRGYLATLSELRINILNQNILFMPDHEIIFKLYKYTSHITQTTAHDRYATQQTSDTYGLPLKHLSVFIDSKNYEYTDYTKKSGVITYSPDSHPRKEEVLSKIQKELPDYRLQEIKNLTYSEYKSVIKSSKFTITFGEGLDGYFIEPAFSGSIPFAVYNDDFFPDESFREYRNVYNDYDSMIHNITDDIRSLDNEKSYTETNRILYDKLTNLYSYNSYVNNLKSFNKDDYDFTPSFVAIRKTLMAPIKNLYERMEKLEFENQNRNRLIASQKETIASQKETIREFEMKISSQREAIFDMANSKSWMLTQPLRATSAFIKKLTK